MSRIDEMSRDLRLLVHEYGLSTVQAFVDCGVNKPGRIRHLIETTLDELSPTRGTFSSQGRQTELLARPSLSALSQKEQT